MISIHDVMVGDFLQNTNGNVGKVIGIQPYNQAPTEVVMSYNGGTCFSDPKLLEPIPITPEILEKNGFVYNDIPFVQGWEQFGLTLNYGGDGFRISCGQNVALVIDSVHELQHALRLCGINKEIAL